jgi:uncharacterized damage-inducible protein DinB
MKAQFMTCLLALLAINGTQTFAQQMPAANATISSVLDQQLSFVESDLISAAEAMPQEKYFFAPTTGEFRDVRSFALQVRHVAFANHLFFGTILGEKPPAGVGGNGPESLKSKEQIVQYLKESFALGHRAIASITPANLVTIIEDAPVPLFNTRLSLATHACSHAYDHYGQMVEYLRMNGIVPPASR